MTEELHRKADRAARGPDRERFSPTQMAIAGLGGAVILIVLIIAITVISRIA